MTWEELQSIFKRGVDRDEKILIQKGKEYTRNSINRTANFEELAQIVKCPHCKQALTPMTIWEVYFLKHVWAILNMATHPEDIDTASESVAERCSDLRNYTHLFEALVSKYQASKVPF